MTELEANTDYPGYAEIETNRLATEKMMQLVKKDLVERHLTTEDAIVHKGWDIHCFFPLESDPNRVIHLQLYMSAPIERPDQLEDGLKIEFPNTHIYARVREMDREEMEEARKLTSWGYEQSAITRYIMPNDAERKQNKERLPILFTQASIASLVEQALSPILTSQAGTPSPKFRDSLRRQLLEQY
jgi:hypothetical protein